METIAQILTNDINKKSIDYPFGTLVKKQKKFFKDDKHKMNVRIQNLKDVINAFSQEGITYWLQGKTLLGMYRDKKLISDDTDEDIGTSSDNIHIVCNKIIPKLEFLGFEVIRATENNSMLSVLKNFRYIDICFFKHKGNNIGYENKFFPKEYYDSFETITIKGFDYSIPTRSKEIIKHSYNISL